MGLYVPLLFSEKRRKTCTVGALEVQEGCHDFTGEIWKDRTVPKSVKMIQVKVISRIFT